MWRIVICVVVFCFVDVSSVCATDIEYREILQEDGSALVEQWLKAREFKTEPVPEGITLTTEEKEKVWSGNVVNKPSTDDFILNILSPTVKHVKYERQITWSDGIYKVVDGSKYTYFDAKMLIYALYIITFTILLIDIIILSIPSSDYGRVVGFNVSILMIEPILILFSILCIYFSMVVFTDSDFFSVVTGVMSVVTAAIAFFVFPWAMSSKIVDLISIWHPFIYLVGIRVLVFLISWTVNVMSMYVFGDFIFTHEISFWVLIEWGLYLLLCCVVLPISIYLAYTVFNVVRKK